MIEKKISIVTPCFNSEKFLEKTILSIKNQNYSNYEHIIIDGGSTDTTLDILKKYEGTYPMIWISEKDHGMYDAINKGFAQATGEIYAWLNSDDVYFPWAFSIMNLVMQHKEIVWCTTGQNSFTDEYGNVFFTGRTLGPRSYSQRLLRKGLYDGRYLGFVQQEGTFWRKSLWDKVKGLDDSKKYAGDFWLWKKFAKYEQLYSVNTVISAFRIHEMQLSANREAYERELPNISFVNRIIGKTKLPVLYTGLMHPFHKFLLQVEDL